MGIYGALTTAVTGLKAQSYALENISGNIANSQTTAFKRTDTSFVDYVVENSPIRQKSGIVSAFSRQTNNIQGDILASQTSTSMAINGEGYFIVEKLFDFSDRQPIFNGEDLYSRRGDFQVDRFGYLVNGGGYFLKGLPVDRQSGNVSGDVPEVLKIPNDFLGAKQTTVVDIRANVPFKPKTVNSGNPTVASADKYLLAPSLRATPVATASDPAVGLTNSTTEEDFLESTIAGGAITVFDENGAPMNVQMRWGKVQEYNAASGNWSATNSDQWRLYYKSADNRYVQIPSPNGPNGNFTFAPDGTIKDQAGPPAINARTSTWGAPPALPQVTMDSTAPRHPLQIGGQVIDGIAINFGETGMTQYSDPSGAYQATELDQDGYPAGEMVDVEITELNRVRANYSNGISIDVAEIPLVSFNSENNLRSLDGGGYAKTQQSGNPILGAEANLVGASLEASNTDIADEFTKLIITQQAYSANTRIVTSSDEMMQETLNMKR